MKRKIYQKIALDSFFLRMNWIMVFLLLMSTSLLAQTVATIETDKDDYPPGATVLITGSGFLPNEDVQLQVLHVGDTADNPTSTAHLPWTIRADENGVLHTSWLVPLDEDEANALLKLTALGLTSGYTADKLFTDAPPTPKCIKKVTISDDQTLCVNATVTALTTALQYNGSTGTPTINYQWYSNTIDNNSTGTLIASATSSTYTPPSNISGVRYYYCVVTGTVCAGTQEVSNTIRVTVYSKSSNPDSATASKTIMCNVFPAKSTVLTLHGGGGGNNAVIKWYKDGCGSGNGGTLVGTGNDLSVKPTVTTTYYGRYEDGTPCNDVTTCSAVTITIESAPAINTGAHYETPVTYGDASVMFTVAASGLSPISYQWSVNTGSGFATISDGVMYNGTGTAVLQLNNPKVAYNGYLYRVTITDACGVATSDANALLVNKKDASVIPDAKTKQYGDVDPVLTGTLNGFLPSDSVKASYSRVAGETVAGSPYDITATLSPIAVLSNYDITYDTAEFTISTKEASVTPDEKSKIYGDADPVLTGTLIGFLPADSVKAVYNRGVGETVLGSPYTISAVLSPVGVLGNYHITYNTADFTITPKNASVTPNAKTKQYGDPDPVLTGNLNGFLPADSVKALYSRVAGETVLDGPYTISAVLSPVGVLGNYNITYNTALFTITPKNASVTPDAKSKQYGDADPVLTGTLNGFLPADSVKAVYSRVAGETVTGSPYTISATLSPVGVLSNYNITYNTANFIITPKEVCVSYNGIQFANPNVGTTQTVVRLSVVLNATGNADARTATVNFVTQNPSGNYVASLEAGSSSTQSVYYYNLPIDLGNNNSQTTQVSWTIGGNFKNGINCAETMTDVTVSLKTGDFLTGGGHIIMTSSAGKYAGETNRKTNFGFNAKWNKNYSNIQGGGFHAIIRNGNFNYQIKATKVSTLTVVPRTSTTPAIAAFTSTNANLTVIDVNTGATVTTMGNCNLVVELSDNCEPLKGSRTTDLIAITLKDSKGQLLYSSNWNVSTAKSVKQILNGGNLQVMSDANIMAPFCNTGDLPPIGLSSQNAVATEVSPVLPLKIKVFPNPSTNQFNVKFDHGTNAVIQIQVFDIAGRMVHAYQTNTAANLTIGADLKPGMYVMKISQGVNISNYKLVKN